MLDTGELIDTGSDYEDQVIKILKVCLYSHVFNFSFCNIILKIVIMNLHPVKSLYIIGDLFHGKSW